MIQRIQSIFLLAVTLCLTVLIFLPIANVIAGSNSWVLSAFSFSDIEGNSVDSFIPIGFVAIVSALVSLISIFLFKNRGLQIKLSKLNLLLISLTLVACVFFTEIIIDKDDPLFAEATVHYQFAVALPIVALILNYLAIRFIKKDEDLIRSADRLR